MTEPGPQVQGISAPPPPPAQAQAEQQAPQSQEHHAPPAQQGQEIINLNQNFQENLMRMQKPI